MLDTMRRVRNYKQATRRRKTDRLFQSQMVKHLIQGNKTKRKSS